MLTLTEKRIQKAIHDAPARAGRAIELKNPGMRGEGRMMLSVRAGDGKTSAVWYAVWYSLGKRCLAKLGSYPAMTLVDASRMFQTDYVPAISAGQDPRAAKRATTPELGTVGELFKAYVDSLRRNGKRSAYDAERILSAMAGAIGPDRPANSIKRGDLVPHLHAVYQRGSAMAEKVRAYLSAAFAFGMRAEGDITLATTTNRWRIEANPVAGIGAVAGAKRAGNRFLSPVEVRIFWLWLLEYSAQCRLASAVLLKIATGQRSEEILRINDAGYYRAAGMLIWETTKTGVPHSIPLPRQAVAILNDLCPNAHGLFFPSIGRPERCAAYNGVGQVIKKFLRLHPGFPHFTARDLRRSWKTLAGAAGISKEWRDKLQNHAGGDVSSKHYDRYDYLDEKRAAMARWSDYLDAVIDGTIDQVGMRGSNVVQLAPAASAAPEVEPADVAGRRL